MTAPDEIEAAKHERAEAEAAKHLLWVEGYENFGTPPGSFVTSLIGAMQNADRQNLSNLLEAFPEYRLAIDILHNEGISSLVGFVVNQEYGE